METRDVTFNLTEEQINAIKVLLGDACDIEEQEEEEEVSFPSDGDRYYFLFPDGYIGCDYYDSDSEVDKIRLSMGNCFKTKEEAEFVAERLRVLHEMKKFAEPEDFKWDGNNFHYYIYYEHNRDVISFGNARCYSDNNIYFKSLEDAEACIKAVGEDRVKKYYLRVEG